MLRSLRRDSTMLEFLQQPIADSTNNFLSWGIISVVFALLFSVAFSQFVPVVPSPISDYHLFGYELNKFGFTFIAVGLFYFIRTALTYFFFAGTGGGKRWEKFYFSASKLFFVFSLVLIVGSIAQFYFNVDRGWLFNLYLITFGVLFVFKLIYYMMLGSSVLPQKWYYKFLYICTLQIVPVLVLWKVLFM